MENTENKEKEKVYFVPNGLKFSGKDNKQAVWADRDGVARSLTINDDIIDLIDIPGANRQTFLRFENDNYKCGVHAFFVMKEWRRLNPEYKTHIRPKMEKYK